jgi:diaminohydroxyphosphoribosylaminopyrimidine deaminase/5-amino-6-(5-phosphoribosylamino)uracil reductase
VNDKHIKYLNEAHRLAKKKFGSTFPNPVVGCLIVKNNHIISKAVTAPEGRPHAEEEEYAINVDPGSQHLREFNYVT